MSSAYRRTLPARPNLEQQKKLARELLRAHDLGDTEAVARVRAALPDKAHIGLTDAQFVLAREYGFTNWHELKQHIEERSVEALPPDERFRKGVRERDAKAVRDVLQRHAKARALINEPIFGFDSPAIVAASDDARLVEVLLEFGADPNRRSDWWAGGFHALYGAKGEAAELLLAAGAVPDACAAASLDRPDLLARMLAQDPARVHERGGDGQTPLHFARSREVADMLLAAGADINARDVDHRSSPAEWMIGDGTGSARWELAKYLVDRGAEADIFLAAALGATDRVRALLEADPSLLQLRTGRGAYGEKKPSSFHIYQWTIGANLTPLHAAAHFGQDETLRVMEKFASNTQRLLLACHRGARDQARAIVTAEPGIVARLGPDDRRALTDEAWIVNTPAVELMLELGFDPSVSGGPGHGASALHCAAWEGSVSCVTALLRYPSGLALVNSREAMYNGTPLSWCCHGSVNCGRSGADHAEVARVLIAAGAAIDAKARDWECSDALRDVIDLALASRA